MLGTKLSPDVYSELRKAARPVFKAQGSILFRTGQPARGAFLVCSGRVRMNLAHSPLYPTRCLGPGSVIGLPATFSGEPYSLTAKADCDCQLNFIPRARLLELLRRNPTVGFQIVRILSEEIFQMRKDVKLNSGRNLSKDSQRQKDKTEATSS